ncbi:MAG: hypothetical protein AVDCRST_MAG79-23, partial [uncultured Thermoleophilia bacterium]
RAEPLARAGRPRRGRPRDHGLPAGARPRGHRGARPGRRGHRRAPELPRRPAGLRAHGRPGRVRPPRRRRPGSRAGPRGGAPARRQARLHGRELPEPGRGDAGARPPAGARPRGGRGGGLGPGGRSVRGAALPRRGRRARRVLRARPGGVRLQPVQDPRARAAARLARASGGPPRRGGGRQAGPRPAHLHGGPARRGGVPRVGRPAPAPGADQDRLRRAAGRHARRPARRAPGRLGVDTPRGRHVRVAHPAGRSGCGRAAHPSRGRGRRLRAGRPVLRRCAARPHRPRVVRHARAAADRRGARAAGPRAGL